MKILGRLALIGIVIFALLQLIRPGIPERPATAEIQAPPQVRHVLEKDCYSCHSDQRRLAWFDQIVPPYWLVRHDILTARQHLNFSTIGSETPAAQKATLYQAVNMIQLGAMPLPKFLALHPEARVTPEEMATLKAYLAPWSSALAAAGPAETSPAIDLASVAPEFGGLSFDPTFESWTPLSFTDRGDNNTLRFILGNDIAVKAAMSGNITPWPNGTRFAKIAWQQELGPDGLVHPGKFVQVELMVKDAQRYKTTEGWAWGRWRGLQLKPYGNDEHFVNECTGCHLPVRGNDYVYTLPITTANVSGQEIVNNAAAALPSTLPAQPFTWHAITMYVDPQTHTMATLYGNAAAMTAVQARGPQTGPPPAYPSGAALALVTWLQRDDPHWFGARIPHSPTTVEFVTIGSPGSYQRYEGATLSEAHIDNSVATQRTNFIVNLAPVRLP